LSGAVESYFCTPDLVLISIAEVAHLVEHDLAKVGVAGSSPVFRSAIPSVMRDGIFFTTALVVELVDTQDLKSCSPKKRVRVRFPPGAQSHPPKRMAFLLQLIYPFLTIASYVIFTDMHFNRNCIL
jgi:hypothetical protein